MEIISRGRAVTLTSEQIADIPKNSWYRYCQLRLDRSHFAAIQHLCRNRVPTNSTSTLSHARQAVQS